MSGVTRFISFVIGLIVLILLFVLIANRFNANRQQAQAGAPTPTPTVVQQQEGGNFFTRLFGRRTTPTPTVAPTAPVATASPQEVVYNGNQGTPEAGSPTAAPSPTAEPTPEQRGFDFFGLFRRATPTPEPQPTLTFDQQIAQATPSGQVQGQNTQGGQTGSVNQIPNTGTPTLVIPLLSAALAAGVWLRKRA